MRFHFGLSFRPKQLITIFFAIGSLITAFLAGGVIK